MTRLSMPRNIHDSRIPDFHQIFEGLIMATKAAHWIRGRLERIGGFLADLICEKQVGRIPW